MLYLGLFLVHNFFGAHLPETILRKIEADSTCERLAKKGGETLNDGIHRQPNSIAAQYDIIKFHLKMRECRKDRLCYLTCYYPLQVLWLIRIYGINPANKFKAVRDFLFQRK